MNRVRGNAKTKNRGTATSSAAQTAVERATEFAVSWSEWRFTFDSESDPNSGNNMHKSSYFFVVVVQSKFYKKTKKRHIGFDKFQSFGDTSKRAQLDLFIPHRGAFRTTVLDLDVLTCTDMVDQECLEESDRITGTLLNVESSCVIALSPSTEEISMLGEDEFSSSHDSMKLAYLKAASEILLLKGKHHINKDGNIKTVNFGDAAHFVSKAASSYAS